MANASGKTERVVSKKQLAALVKESKTVKERTSSIAGTFGERVAAAVENGHLDKKAFAVVASLAKMKDEVARDRAVRNIPLYIDMLREEGLLPTEHVGDLDEMAKKAAADGGDDGDADDEADADAPEITGTADDAIRKMDAVAKKGVSGEEFAKAALPAMGEAPGSYSLKN